MGMYHERAMLLCALVFKLPITKIKEIPLSIIDLIENGTLTSEMAAQIWIYMEGLRIRPSNIIIAGGPGAGNRGR